MNFPWNSIGGPACFSSGPRYCLQYSSRTLFIAMGHRSYTVPGVHVRVCKTCLMVDCDHAVEKAIYVLIVRPEGYISVSDVMMATSPRGTSMLTIEPVDNGAISLSSVK